MSKRCLERSEDGPNRKASIRTAASLIGKAPSTLQRWKRTNPELYRAVMEYAEKRGGSDMAHRDVTGAIADHWKSEHDKVKAQRDQLREALELITEAYTDLVNCGDCGHWNPEHDEEVVAARTALANTEKTP